MIAETPPADAPAPRPTAAGAPLANVLTDGFLSAIPRVPENFAAVNERGRMWFNTLRPQNDFHAWLVEDVARLTLKLERVARIERRERDRIALRAEHFWDDDRALEAEELGKRLATDPAGTTKRLMGTPQGCDWMIRRWALLAREADRKGGWDAAQAALAFDLLGVPPGFRDGVPGRVVDGEGRESGEATGPAAVARREIAALRERRIAVADADALDRAMAVADMSDGATAELRRLRRHEATLHKRLRWCLHQLQEEPRHRRPNPNLGYLFESEPAAGPEAAEPPAPVVPVPSPDPGPTPDPGAAAPPEPGSVASAEAAPAPAPSRRRDPRALKAEIRRRSKRRRADRPAG